MKKTGEKLVREGIFISVISLISKGMGIIREIALAYFFGTSKLVDAYRISMSSVFLPLHTVVGFALNDSLIPTFKNLWANNRKKLLWILVNQLSFLLTMLGIIIVLLIELFARGWIKLLAPGFDIERINLAVQITRWMVLVIPFYIASSLIVIVLNSFYIFKVPSLKAALQNLFLLGAIYLTVRVNSPAPLGQAYPLAFIFFLLLLLLQLKRRWKFVWSNNIQRIKKVWAYYLVSFLPLLIFVFIQRVNILADKIISSFLAVGSIASLEYARFIIETPAVTVGLGLVQVTLPFYSELYSTGQKDKLLNNVKSVVYFGLILMIPFSLFLWLEAEDVIKIIFGYGKFKSTSIDLTASALRGFSFGLWAYFSAYFLQRVYNAQRKNGPLLLFAALSLGCNIVLNIILSRIIGIEGIAVATSVANILFFLLLIFFLDKKLTLKLFRITSFLFSGVVMLGYGLLQLKSQMANLAQRIIVITLLETILWVGWLMLSSDCRILLRKKKRTIQRFIKK